MSVTTKASKKQDPQKAEQAAAFRAMALQLDGEMKEGKHTERLAKAAQEVQGLERYSPLNQLLIVTQFPQATEVHGYGEWQELGQQVRKGEHGIAIRAPHTKKPKEGEESAGVGFHRVYVFDITQTDPISQPEAPAAQEEAETPAAVSA